MRIAMIGPFGFHPNKTMQVRALPLARALVQHGHAVAIFMPPWQTPQEADRRWEEAGVELRYVPLGGGVVGVTRRLVKEALAFRPDVAHCFKPKAYSGLAAWQLWTFHRRLRLVVDADDWEGWGGWNEIAPYSRLQKRFFAWQEQWGLRHCHALTVASRALETIALSMGVETQRVVYVPNGPGILAGEQGSRGAGEQGKRPTVLVYSRLFEFDVGRLVAVLRGVKTAVPNLTILSVGAGLFAEDAAQLRQQFAQAGLLECVTDAGWVAPEALPALLAQADVGVYLMEDTLLNRTKCPVKLADMAALGIPVVGEAVGQVPEYVVNGRTGLLRPPGDVDGLTADLVRLLQDADLRRQMSAAARTHMEDHFTWPRLAAHLEAAYQPES